MKKHPSRKVWVFSFVRFGEAKSGQSLKQLKLLADICLAISGIHQNLHFEPD
jgi:hypothetical protein